MEEILLGFASKALNLDGEQLSSLLYKADGEGKPTKDYNENALPELLRLHAAHIDTVRGKVDDKAAFDRGHGAGKKEALEKFEKEVRQAFGIETDAKGLDLVRFAASSFAKNETSPDKIKLPPEFLAAESRWRDEMQKSVGEWQGKYKELEGMTARQRKLSEYMPKIEAQFSSLNPVLPTAPDAAAFQKQQFLAAFETFDFVSESGKDYVIKDGKRLENAQGHPLTLAEVVRGEAAKRFDFAVQNDKGAAANRNTGTPGETGSGATKFENHAAYLAAWQAEKDPAERVKLTKAWQEIADTTA